MIYFLTRASLSLAFAAAIINAQTNPPPSNPPTSDPLSFSLDWPNLYDPHTVLDLHIKITRNNLNSINNDGSYETEVPALFWEDTVDGEASAQLVSIRRKSGDLLAGGKVSYKIDINEYEGDPRDTNGLALKKWHDVKKLSLENGDDQNIVSEQLAWFLNMASKDIVYPQGHVPGMANYATLTAHIIGGNSNGPFDFDGGVDESKSLGVYVNVEQPDKQFLKNRGVWESDQTYLYKIGEALDQKEVGCEDDLSKVNSPQSLALACAPFGVPGSGGGSSGKGGKDKGRNLRAEEICTFDQMNSLIDMEVMIAHAAIEAFVSSLDDLVSKGKNIFFVDYSDETCTTSRTDKRRTYYQWDLDAAFLNVDSYIYGSRGNGKSKISQSIYQRVIFNEQAFLDMFNANMAILLDDSEGSIVNQAIQFLADMEPTIMLLLQTDPSMSGGMLDAFLKMPVWLQERQGIVGGQICNDSASSGTSCA